MSELDIVTFEYMNNFKCLGSECPEHCCSGWAVNFDRRYYDRLKRTMGKSKDTRNLFNIAVNKYNDDSQPEHIYAHFVHKENDDCSMLDDEGWCSIQSKFDEALLCNVCSMYPRRLIQVNDHLELTAMPSCPEIASLLLLSDNPVSVTALKEGLLPRTQAHGRVTSDDPRLLHQYYEDIRTVFLHLLVLKDWTLEQRLFFIAYFAKRVSDFMDIDSGEDKLPLLAQEIEYISRQSMQEELATNYAQLKVPVAPAMAMAGQVLDAGSKNKRATRFVELVTAVRESLGEALYSEDTAERVISKYSENKAAVFDKCGDRVDHYTIRYCANYFVNVPLFRAQNLLTFVQRMAISIAIQRFLLCNDPTVLAALDKPDDEFLTILDAQAVQTLYATARAVEHSTLLTDMEQKLQSINKEMFANVVFLLRF